MHSGTDELDALIALLNPRPGERVLDLGCGTGRAAARLAAAGARVTGIDRNAAALEQARMAAPGEEFVCCDFFAYQPEAPFDAILANAVLDWLQPPRAAAQRLAAWLAAGGRLAANIGAAGPAMQLLASLAGTLGAAPAEAPAAASPAQWVQALEAAGFRIEFCSMEEQTPAAGARARILARKI